MLIYVWCVFRLSLQGNWLRKPIHSLYGVVTLQEEQPPHSGGTDASRSSPANLFCFQLFSCLLNGETGNWRRNKSLFANLDLHPSALPTTRFVVSSFHVLRLVLAAPDCLWQHWAWCQTYMCNWVMFKRTPIERGTEMFNEKENESFWRNRMGTVKLFSHSKARVEPCPLTAWLPVGYRPKVFPAILFHPCITRSLFCCQVRKHLLLLLFMSDKVVKGTDYPGRRTEIEEMPSCVFYFPPPSVKRVQLSQGLFETIRRLLL